MGMHGVQAEPYLPAYLPTVQLPFCCAVQTPGCPPSPGLTQSRTRPPRSHTTPTQGARAWTLAVMRACMHACMLACRGPGGQHLPAWAACVPVKEIVTCCAPTVLHCACRHRKVQAYIVFQDARDKTSHGTSTSGCVAGAPLGPNGTYTVDEATGKAGRVRSPCACMEWDLHGTGLAWSRACMKQRLHGMAGSHSLGSNLLSGRCSG